MLKLLIVEDEILERELLKELIRVHYPDLFWIQSTGNGKRALEIAKKELPDIMLVDINIQGITGLELISELTRAGLHTQIVIITAYASFDYAQEAVKYGAVRYLLKPVSDEELCESIDQCLDLYQKKKEEQGKKNRLQEGFHRLDSYARKHIFQEFSSGKLQVGTLPQIYGWPEEGRIHAVTVWIEFDRMPDPEWMKQVQILVTQIYGNYFLVLQEIEKHEVRMLLQIREEINVPYLHNILWAASQTIMQNIRRMIKEQSDWGKSTVTASRLWISEFCTGYDQLSKQLKNDVRRKVLASDREFPENLIFQPILSTRLYSNAECTLRIQKAVRRMKEGKAERAAGQLKAYFEKCEYRWSGFCALILAVIQYAPEAELLCGLEQMKSEQPYELICRWLKEQVIGNGQESSGENSIQDALKIMEQEYSLGNLSQTMIAERLGFNASYFSRLFKKETGKNFVNVLAEIRIDHAKEYLKQGIQPSEVALLCGYHNKKYFYEAFRVQCGVSPMQYQKGEQAVE